MRNMSTMKFLVYVLFVLGCQALTVQSESCKLENKLSGNIEDSLNARRLERCWIIKVPKRNIIKINVNSLDFTRSFGNNGLVITDTITGHQLRITHNYQVPQIIFGSDVKITHYVHANMESFESKFQLSYKIVTAQSKSCTLESKLSGNIEDTLDARNEERCWIIKVPRKHILTINVNSLYFEYSQMKYNGLEITEINNGYQLIITHDYQVPEITLGSDVKITHYAQTKDFNKWKSQFQLSYKIEKGFLPVKLSVDFPEWGVSWLKNQSSETKGWKEDTPRAVVALFLSSAVNFDGTVFEEELMANQVELKTSVALLKSSNTINELSMLVNALLVTCYNPRNFYDIDVVKRLKTVVESSKGVTHPVAYLALCNANETWPEKAFGDLEFILNATTDLQLNKDMKAMAVMALTCYSFHNENKINRDLKESYNVFSYENTIDHFKSLQLEDGSFGNVYTTALIAQALLSDGDRNWNINATAEYLVNKLNTSMNFLTAYLVLPFLNLKSLVDISNTNCSAHPRRHGDDISDEDKEVLVPIMQVKYSLYVGEEKLVIQAMFLSVPVNSTAYEIMELAESENPKYKFERENISGKINVFEISDIPNDPENAKYWMVYVSSPMNQENISHSAQSPNELIMKNGQHLVMWYRGYYF